MEAAWTAETLVSYHNTIQINRITIHSVALQPKLWVGLDSTRTKPFIGIKDGEIIMLMSGTPVRVARASQ